MIRDTELIPLCLQDYLLEQRQINCIDPAVAVQIGLCRLRIIQTGFPHLMIHETR